MGWFNYYGLAIMVVIMVPNIVYALQKRGGMSEVPKWLTAAENVGRYGCMAFMIFNLPWTWYGYFVPNGDMVYLIFNGVLLAAYCLTWVALWRRETFMRAILLSVLPSAIFLGSGVLLVSIPLLVCAVLFAITHITISVKGVPRQTS